MNNLTSASIERVSLVQVLDRVLNKGAVISGQVTISVADIDLIQLDLQLLLGSVETLINAAGLTQVEAYDRSHEEVRQ